MSNTIINIENISKKYLIGKGQSGSLRETLSNTFRKTLGQKEIDTEEFWALRDINFEVKQGDAVGIIGRNGAGKSTLLKLLSKITYPTTGKITLKGRVSSLLEVGTGFHPELTGRENIFLNGTILGMSRKEVKSKFDEIVDFSGIERFLDTPVKRYSSGMYVRLAFAVAAHLEPEVLIIDEVLAVGDIEFQKKCLGKMGEVAQGGRTVIFVSHNMGAVQSLCNKGTLLNNGEVVFNGNAEETIQEYYKLNSSTNEQAKQWTEENAPGNENIKLLKIEAKPLNSNVISIDSGINIIVDFFNYVENINLDCTIEINTLNGVTVYHKGIVTITDKSSKKGTYYTQITIPPNLLNEDIYVITLIFGKDQRYLLYQAKDIVQFEINALGSATSSKRPGIIYLDFDKKIDFHEA